MDKMNDMTPQEIFDKVVNHLRAQGAKSMNGDACRYRSSDGMMCAAGCLIPDSEYSSEIEDLNVDSVPFFENLSERVLYLLFKLQGLHDRVDVGDWEPQLRRIAHYADLTYTPVSEVSP